MGNTIMFVTSIFFCISRPVVSAPLVSEHLHDNTPVFLVLHFDSGWGKEEGAVKKVPTTQQPVPSGSGYKKRYEERLQPLCRIIKIPHSMKTIPVRRLDESICISDNGISTNVPFIDGNRLSLQANITGGRQWQRKRKSNRAGPVLPSSRG